MKRVLLLLSLAFGLATPAAFAQSDDHIQAGLYADYFRLPGGGLEGHLGPVGLRLDVGDEIYFAGGAHHNNLRVAFGPYI